MLRLTAMALLLALILLTAPTYADLLEQPADRSGHGAAALSRGDG